MTARIGIVVASALACLVVATPAAYARPDSRVRTNTVTVAADIRPVARVDLVPGGRRGPGLRSNANLRYRVTEERTARRVCDSRPCKSVVMKGAAIQLPASISAKQTWARRGREYAIDAARILDYVVGSRAQQSEWTLEMIYTLIPSRL